MPERTFGLEVPLVAPHSNPYELDGFADNSLPGAIKFGEIEDRERFTAPLPGHTAADTDYKDNRYYSDHLRIQPSDTRKVVVDVIPTALAQFSEAILNACQFEFSNFPGTNYSMARLVIAQSVLKPFWSQLTQGRHYDPLGGPRTPGHRVAARIYSTSSIAPTRFFLPTPSNFKPFDLVASTQATEHKGTTVFVPASRTYFYMAFRFLVPSD